MLTIICNKFIQSVYESLFDVGVGEWGLFSKDFEKPVGYITH